MPGLRLHSVLLTLCSTTIFGACSTEVPQFEPEIISQPGPRPKSASRLKFDVGSMPTPASDPDPAVPEELRERLSTPGALGLPLRSYSAVRKFYEQRDYRPAWTRARRISAVGVDALRGLAQLRSHGLDPEDYGATALKPTGPQPHDAIAFELVLTDGWITAASHLGQGRMFTADWLAAATRPPPKGARFDLKLHWPANDRADALIERLEQAVTDGNPGSTLIEQAPTHPEYAARVEALGSALTAMATDRGDATTSRLIEQIPADLERLRWLPPELGARHVRVDLGARTLSVHDSSAPPLTMAVAVSRDCAQIPGLSTTITEVEVEPANEAHGAFDLHTADGIALHDSPSPFDASQVLTTGCIRPESPQALAEALLRPTMPNAADALSAARAKGEPTILKLGTPVPLHVTRTTVILEGTSAQLRKGSDAANELLLRALSGGPEPLKALPATTGPGPETKTKTKPKPKPAP